MKMTKYLANFPNKRILSFLVTTVFLRCKMDINYQKTEEFVRQLK